MRRKNSGRFVLMSFVMGAMMVVAVGACSDDDSSGPGVDAAVGDDAATQEDAAVEEDAAQGDDAAVGQDGTVETDGGDMDGGSNPYELTLYVEGDLTPKTFTDGYAGQTPSFYTMGISRFDIMTSENDTNPVTVFDYGESYTEVDMLSTSVVGTADLSSIPANVYTHGKVLLKMTRFDVDTTVHTTMPPASVPGTLSVVAALSDTEIDGTQRSQDWVQYTFDVAGGITTTGTLPELPSTAGGRIERENGETWLVFEFNQSLTILPIPGQAHSATITYEVFESFRWDDQDAAGYTIDVFDSNSDGTSEPVMNFGATGYQIDVQ